MKQDKNVETSPLISYETLLTQFKQLLRSEGQKFTKQREVILHTLYNHSGHFTPEELYRLIKQENPELSTGIATIYRTLSLLERAGIVTSISFGTQGKKYELGVKAHHDHIICTKCGKILEFFDEAIEKKQERIAKEFGFEMEDHSLKIFGICPECQKKTDK
ncbi:Fur family transcriptional regulator [Hydrogenimonas cancrithermarum]|uniref:Ferric uptake regulation protein n=1 Tax=Hydrogenimonas cancrithermarum TaxID=2993563 RepID=A0ABM8FLK6_9BACT|nr:Fur family transcriptional regulator [Hydrogenimonas cancrithermarum]BDY12289.1 ferric uptake regulation protein [Hydrogenimonas cancrithermarum]